MPFASLTTSELIKALVLNAQPAPIISTAGRAWPAPHLRIAAIAGAGTSFYNVMASERSIRDYARSNLFYDHRRVTDRLVTNFYATSHQAGAQHAIAAFLSGYLNTDTRAPFARLTNR